jgi:hypothetical protein
MMRVRASRDERTPVRTNDSEHQVKLTLTGERAERGIPLADFESFIDAFIAALRD